MSDFAETQDIFNQYTEESQGNNKTASIVDFKMVTFSLSGKDYAIDIMYVKEIAKAGRFTYVPNTLPFVLGVYNLRGDIIPILDLRLFFNIDVPERDDNKMENLLILTLGDQTFGVVVDKIDKVVGVQKSTIQPPHPLFGDINIKYIYGVVESGKNLYVLLDIERIFGSKASAESAAQKRIADSDIRAVEEKIAAPVALVERSTSVQPKSPEAPVVEESPAVQPKQDVTFVAESLKNYKKFNISSINESWVMHRFKEWTESGKGQIQNEAEAQEFLSPFYSSCTGNFWNDDYASAVEKILPDNHAKQIMVWNPGCGGGQESFSLACVLAKRYSGAKIRIYAQDTDLLAVSNAPLMSVPSSLKDTWMAPYLAEKANGECTFKQDIKDSVMFEYHDCKNTNALPMVDLIFTRDMLSFIDDESLDGVVADFQEKMKGNAVIIVGENENLSSGFGFGENTVGALTAYTKE